MIYDDKTLNPLTLKKLKEIESNLTESLKANVNQWLSTYYDNEFWLNKVESDIHCLKQVRKYIKLKLD